MLNRVPGGRGDSMSIAAAVLDVVAIGSEPFDAEVGS